MLFFLVSLFAYASIRPQSREDGSNTQYAVMFKPNVSHLNRFKKIVRAGGLPVRHGTFDFIIIVATKQDDFKKTIEKEGAFFVFSPMIRGGCFIDNKARLNKQDLVQKSI